MFVEVECEMQITENTAPNRIRRHDFIQVQKQKKAHGYKAIPAAYNFSTSSCELILQTYP